MEHIQTIVRDDEHWKHYTLGNVFHRTDGPAIECIYGNFRLGHKYYYQFGKLHRLDGPAVIEDHEEYWIDGKQYTMDDFNRITNNYEKYFYDTIGDKEFNPTEKLTNDQEENIEKLKKEHLMMLTTFETLMNSHDDLNDTDKYFHIPKQLVMDLLDKISQPNTN